MLRTTLQSTIKKRGIKPTLYGPCLHGSPSENTAPIQKLQEDLRKIDKRIGFAHVIPQKMKVSEEKTGFGVSFLGSPLSHQLLQLERSFLVLSTLPSLPSEQDKSGPELNIKVPFKFIDKPQAAFPYSNGEEMVIQ